ncbi:hypothetical protein GCM10010294_18850 [Streptomyces griseoloalbus]|nr:hypothetical protein GCM10010294_18850 [Streptomyces griseoloalbus]
MTLADAIVPLALASPTAGHGRHGPGGQLPREERRVVLRAAYDGAMQLELGLLWSRTSPTASKAWEVPPGVQVCRMRGLTGVRLCRNPTVQGNSPLRVKAHIPFGPRESRKSAHTPTPPG